MKYRLPIVIPALVLLWACPTVLADHAEGLAAPTPGQQLVRAAARNLAAQPSLEAKIRQRVALFGQYLVGSGSYRQLVIGQRKMLRLELKLQVAETTTSLLQVSDGSTLWEKRNLGNVEQLGYVTVRRIREAVQRQGAAGRFDQAWMALGGLDQLLRGLTDYFQFGNPVPQQIGGMPVWEIRGQWKAEKLAALFPNRNLTSSRAMQRLPAHMPHAVVVTLGRDQKTPLFPYRIDYQRNTKRATGPDQGSTGDEAELFQSIVTIELFEVQRYTSIDSRHFVFQFDQTDEQVEDLTAEYLARMNLPQEEPQLGR